MSKEVSRVEEYSYKQTDFVTVETKDGWIYRFMRPNEHEPYRYDMKQRPDGSRNQMRKTKTPEPVVEYMEQTYDAAQLHPERKKSTDTWEN